MGSEPIGVIALTLVTAAFLLFVAIELAGLTLPGFHTISYLGHHSPALKYTLVVAVLLFDAWLWWHLSQPVPK